ncbi:MAG: hypothetical protein ABW195_05265 [Ilumatobacteraceae bacterium]
MTTSGITGVLGQDWRADVTARGAVEPWDGSTTLSWHIAADDRGHSPDTQAAGRPVRVLGAPVFETRLRVPGGDAVHRVWSVADAGGCTVVEVLNDSPLPLACAFTRPDVLTSRPPADVPIQGIALDAATTVLLPVGHRASITVGLAHDGRGQGPLPAGLPSAEATARGWVALAERAGRVVLPDERSSELLVAARTDVLLAGPPPADEDPAGFLLGLAELVRMGELDGADTSLLVPDAAAAIHEIALRPGWDIDAALDAAALVLAAAGERRAVADMARITTSRTPAPLPDEAEVEGVRVVAAFERRLAAGPVLLPSGIPEAWRGSNFEAHGLPVGPASTVSFAVRWHGEHAAVLWEVTGDPVELCAPAVDPAWRTSAPSGDALWRLDRAV